MKIPLVIVISLLTIAFAGNYEVNVTREDDNLYRVTTQDILISTQFCFQFVYYVDAYLRMSGSRGDITFLDSSTSCNVQGVYGDLGLEEGTYSITISRESANWYRIAEIDGFVQTSLCLNLALSDDATLLINRFGSGSLYFEDGDDCDVKKVYGVLDL